METKKKKKKTGKRKMGRCNDIHLDYLQDTLSSSKNSEIKKSSRRELHKHLYESEMKRRKGRRRERERRRDSVIGE